MERQYTNLDADESIFFNRSLEAVKVKTYDKQYPELLARTLIPVSFDTPSGATTITYRSFDVVGMAKIISNYSSDIPRIDLRGKEFTSKIKSIAAGYGYSIQDIRAARLTNMPLETRLSNGAKRAMLLTEDEIAVVGDADHGLVGLLSHPNVPDVAIPADGTGSSSLWSAKTADQIIRDINLLINQIVVTTSQVESPDTLLLPIGAHTVISTVRVPDTSKTILQYIKETNPWIKTIMPWAKLTGRGAGGTDVMVAYRRDPDKLTLEVPQDFEQMPVQEIGLEYIVNCHQRSGGVIIYYPLSIAKADGI